MININKEKLALLPALDKNYIENWFEEKSNASYFSKVNIYSSYEKCKIIMEEEKEAVEKFTQGKRKNQEIIILLQKLLIIFL